MNYEKGDFASKNKSICSKQDVVDEGNVTCSYRAVAI
jgi:hypothetical protein